MILLIINHAWIKIISAGEEEGEEEEKEGEEEESIRI